MVNITWFRSHHEALYEAPPQGGSIPEFPNDIFHFPEFPNQKKDFPELSAKPLFSSDFHALDIFRQYFFVSSYAPTLFLGIETPITHD